MVEPEENVEVVSCDNGQFRASEDAGDDNIYPMNPSLAVIRVVLIILLRAGFLLVQIGNIPVINVNLIVLHNIIEICWTTSCYILIGSTITFTGDFGGVIGGGYWIGHERTDKEKSLIGWQSVIIASAISSNCMAGRMHTVGTLVIGIIFAGLLQPLIIHWGWSTDGWMLQNRLTERNSGFLDAGGAAIINVTGGLVGFIACLILGRSVQASNVDASAGNTFLGYFFILLGLQSSWLSNDPEGNFHLKTPEIPLIMINNLLSISTCTIVTVALHFFCREAFNQKTVMRCVQGMIAGVVVVSAGANIYPPYISVVIGATNGFLFYLVTRIIARCAIEDYCNTVAIHLISGLFGALIVPFFAKSEDGFSVFNLLIDFTWQLICLLCIIAVVVMIMMPLLMSFECCGILRNRFEHLSHLRALATVSREPPRSFIRRLFHRDVESALMQADRVPSQEPETATGLRSVKHEPGTIRIESPDQRMIDPKIQHNADVTAQPESKMRKLRSIHTIKSVDNFCNNESMNVVSSPEVHRTFGTIDLNRLKNIEHLGMNVLLGPKFEDRANGELEDEDIFDQLNSSKKLRCDIDTGGFSEQFRKELLVESFK